MRESDFVLGFSNASGVGPKGFQKLLKYFGSAEKAWEGNEDDFKKCGVGKANFSKFNAFRNLFDFDDYNDKLQKAKVKFIPFGPPGQSPSGAAPDELYPASLKEIDSPPIGLFIKGNKDLLTEENKIGVVGARKITSYGRQVTENLVTELCLNNFVIVSGMAMGVDAVAHETAVKNDGKTIAVLGCGVDCPYPRENESLYEKILDSNNLIISEYPLGMSANAGTFPARNRIIAGLSSSVLITEAAEDSGSLITAEQALLQGKKIFAVPGQITSIMSRGSLKLLKQGGTLVSSADDILNSLNMKKSFRAKADGPLAQNLPENQKLIVECLESEERTMDELVKLTKIPMSELSVILSEMELSGIILFSTGKFGIR